MFSYERGNETEAEVIESELELFNKRVKKTTQKEDHKKFTVIVKKDNEIVGGGIACSSLYYIGYFETLWVNPIFRKQSIGSQILLLLEKSLLEYGCDMCHLETVDFQAPSFYKKNGYEVFGELHYQKQNLTEFFLKKNLS